MQELCANAIVEAKAAGDFLHVAADLFAEISDLIDEGNLHSEKCVRRILGELSRWAPGEDQRRVIEIEGL